MKIPVLNINIDPRTPEGKAALGSLIRAVGSLLVGAGLLKVVDEGQVNAIIAGIGAVLTIGASWSWSQAGDRKLVDTKTDQTIAIVEDHVGPVKAEQIATAVEELKDKPIPTKP